MGEALPGGEHPADASASAAGSTAPDTTGGCGRARCDGGCFSARQATGAMSPTAVHTVEFGALARHLPLLNGALTMTGNRVALLSESGIYATPSASTGPLLWEEDRVNLRLAAPIVSAVEISDEVLTDRIPAMVSVVDATGRTLHRGYLLCSTDRDFVDGLGRDRDGAGDWQSVAGATALPGADAADELAALLDVSPGPTGIDWAVADQLDHLDSIIVDGGTARYSTLSSYRMPRSRRIDRGVLPMLFQHLCHLAIPVTTAVATTGCMQFHRGTFDLIDPAPGTLTAASGRATIAIDLDTVADCWLVTSHGIHGSTSMVELYDVAGNCVALLTQLGAVGQDTVADWQALTASLPQ